VNLGFVELVMDLPDGLHQLRLKSFGLRPTSALSALPVVEAVVAELREVDGAA